MHDTQQQTTTQFKKHHQQSRPTVGSRLIRLPEVMNRVSLSRTSIYNRMNDGTFPKPVKLGPRAIAWQESSIDEWISDCIELAQAEEVRS